MIYHHYGLKSTATDAVNAFVSKRIPGREWHWASRDRGIFRVMIGRKTKNRRPFVVSVHVDKHGVPSWIVAQLMTVTGADPASNQQPRTLEDKCPTS